MRISSNVAVWYWSRIAETAASMAERAGIDSGINLHQGGFRLEQTGLAAGSIAQALFVGVDPVDPIALWASEVLAHEDGAVF